MPRRGGGAPLLDPPSFWAEKADSRSQHIDRDEMRTSVTLKYITGRTEDDALLRAYCSDQIPQRYLDLHLQNFDLEPLTGGYWEVVAQYGFIDRSKTVYTLDTSGGTEHVTQSLATRNRYGNAPDLGGTVGFDGEMVQGADIYARRFAWNERYRISAAYFTMNYRLTLFNLTYTVNSSAFRGLSAGEVMFMGATCSQQGFHDVDITYYFEGSPNKVGVGGAPAYYVGTIPVTVKRGWDYQWVRYLKKESGNRIIESPDGVYIEKMYDESDFAGLGIGTGTL